jgi:predicted AlkP superfamily pyrophosphatase or phosphodiesterase
MRVYALLFVAILTMFSSCKKKKSGPERPKIVIGVVVDQMRWDYLYRYYDRYGKDGFKRLLNKGYECRQTMINYLPTFTAPGHSCIYTGSVPALHGIAGNEWVDAKDGKMHYCVDDESVTMTGDQSEGHSMSPANLLTTTVTDELRLATNFKSRVYGVALKDRSSILPAGHLANAAYWYNDKTGHFISSTYYKNPNPEWLQQFNKRNVVDSFLNQGWELLYDKDSYSQSTEDANNYEGAFKWENSPVFPHRFDGLKGKERNAVIKTIPAGNTYSIMMAKACMEGEELGLRDYTDFITLSLSATDYVGHRFAPNSMEAEDTYLRLDKDLAELLNYMDRRYGRNGYLLFLTADHGGAHNPRFLTDNKVPAGVEPGNVFNDLNVSLKEVFGIDSLITFTENYQVCLDETKIKRAGADRESIRVTLMSWLGQMPEISYVIDMEHMYLSAVPEPIRTMVINGYNKNRSGSIQLVLNPAWFGNEGRLTGTTHGTWNPYDAHIPLIWYGWNVAKGSSSEVVNMTDIAATVADLLHIQMPNGCIGKPIRGINEKHH